MNSEEGYQNLRRFLCGTRKVTAQLVGSRLPPSTGKDVIDVWQAEVRVSIRGLPVLLTEQRAAHYCPIELGTVTGADAATRGGPSPGDDAVAHEPGKASLPGAAVTLAAVFLLDPQQALQMQRENLQPGIISPRCRYSLQLSVLHLKEKHGLFFWRDHLETLPEWDDALIVDVGPTDDGHDEHLWAAWQSENPGVTSVTDPITAQPWDPDPGITGPLSFTIPLPQPGQHLLGPDAGQGPPAAIRLTVEKLA